ncbi:MAG: tetratricopeptide repeat protein [Ideonella sp.]|nr:tetratricopeptide repeat protein [Ideonella sp.]
MSRIDELKQQIAQLDVLIRDGVLTGEAAREARTRLEADLLAQVLHSGETNAAARARGHVAATPSPMQATPPASAVVPVSGRMKLGLAVFVLVFAGAGYLWLGNRTGLAIEPGMAGPAGGAESAQGAAGAASSAHAMGVGQIEGMIARLAERLKASPEDAEGWAMMGRSYAVLGRHSEAMSAFRKVVELKPKDAQGYADLADAMGSANGRSLDGEPEKLIKQALSLDPKNPKSLFLSGTLAFNRNDAATAAKQWELAMRGMDPASDMAQQLQGALDEARQRAGLPQLQLAAVAAGEAPSGSPAAGTATGAAGMVAAATPPAASAGPEAITGRVTLAASLKAKAAPDDAVFIFARAVGGGKAPLAILRKQVKDLPFDFTLDDTLAMSPAMRLSTVKEVQVGARISKSGTAMPQPGDLQGLSGTLKVGAKGIVLEIAETVP